MFYFVVVIMLVGSTGFLYELVTNCKVWKGEFSGLVMNASNIFIALIAASSVELILIREDDLDHPYRKNDVQIIGIAFLILGFLFWMLSVQFQDKTLGVVFSITGLFLSYLYWWIANAGNKILVPPNDPTSTVGGSAGSSGLSGDTSSFKTK